MTLSFQVLHFQECGYLPGGGEKEVREEEGGGEIRGEGRGVKGEGGERKREGEDLSNSGAFPASKKEREKELILSLSSSRLTDDNTVTS